MKRSNPITILSATVIAFFLMEGVSLPADWTIGTDSIYVTNTNVGIGTTNPGAKLEVITSGTTIPSLGTKGTGLNILRSDSLVGLSIGYSGTNGDTWMQSQRTDSAVAYNIDLQPNGGNVGIGTVGPVAKAHIRGSGTSGQVTASWLLENASSGTLGLDITGTAGASRARWLYGGGPSTGTNTLTEAMTIMLEGSKSGNIGIGTTEPVAKEHIRGSGTSGQVTASWLLENASSGTLGLDITGTAGASRARWLYGGGPSTGTNTLTETMTIILEGSKSGNVGIGTISPSFKLDVNGVISSTVSSGINLLLTKTSGSAISFYDGINSNALIEANAASNKLEFWTNTNSNSGIVQRMTIDNAGNVGIGTTNPQSKLAVNGTITTTEVKVTTSGWSDYVFDKGYALPSLAQVESYIEKNKHLPDVPSAKEIQENGLSMAEMMAKQMQKIEELTLYIIEQNNRLNNVEKENQELRAQVTELKDMN